MRLGQMFRLAVAEAREVRARSTISGGRDALAERARYHLDIDALKSEMIGEIARSQAETTGALRSEMDELRARNQLVAGEISTLLQQITEVRESITQFDCRLDEALRSPTELEAADMARKEAELHLQAMIPAVTSWIMTAHVQPRIPISVVMATRDRSSLLSRAIESLLQQQYTHWEAVIVDDGSTDDTPAVLERLAVADDRITVISQPRRGVGAARNAGLAAATGHVICYLDDDNLMDSLWLKAVAWAFEEHPDIDVLYGARIVERPESSGHRLARLPYLHFEAFDRRRLEVGNFVDLGTIAHRHYLPEGRFDESLEVLGDWDLILRLTEHSDPLALPVLALTYSTSADHRISSLLGKKEAATEAIIAGVRARAPMRVLGYNSLFPLVSETYIGDEMRALANNGAKVAWCTGRPSVSPVTVTDPLYSDLERALAEFQPDVILVHWATWAEEQLAQLEREGVPFALRVHSFDFDVERVESVRNSPLCIGVWAYPHHARLIPQAHDLVPLITSWSDFSEPAELRPIVMSTLAGVPKKDWPTLVGAFSQLADKGADCRIILGLTYGLHGEPDRVRELIAATGSQVKLSVDVPHDEVVSQMARASAVVYTKTPEAVFGMPRSIIEGMCASTSVILPDAPEARLVAGPNCRVYRTAEDIVRHSEEALAGGPEIEAERRANRAFAFERYADPALAATFKSEVAEALARWRGARGS